MTALAHYGTGGSSQDPHGASRNRASEASFSLSPAPGFSALPPRVLTTALLCAGSGEATGVGVAAAGPRPARAERVQVGAGSEACMENVEGQPLAFPHLGLTPLTAPAEPGRLRDFCGAVLARRLPCGGRAEHQSGASARLSQRASRRSRAGAGREHPRRPQSPEAPLLGLVRRWRTGNCGWRAAQCDVAWEARYRGG